MTGFTFTCSFACAIGLLHDETNTKLSIEQDMVLKKSKMNIRIFNIDTYTYSIPYEGVQCVCMYVLPGSFLSQSIKKGIRVKQLR